MSIQQSVNQAISGSLFLLNQTDAFQRMKAIKSAKREMEVNTEVGKMKGEGSDASQKVSGEQGTAEQVGANTAEGNTKNNVDEREVFSRKQRSMLEDMFMKLQKSIAESGQAKKSEDFRKMVLQGVYVKGDKWDGK